MKWRSVNTIFRKELLDTARDKRTLMMMLGVPVVLYPAIILIGLQVALVQQSRLEGKVLKIAVSGEAAPLLETWLQDYDRLEIASHAQPQQALENGDLDAVLISNGPTSTIDAGGSLPIEVRYDSTEPESRDAIVRVREALTAVFNDLQAARLRTAEIAPEYVNPLKVDYKDVVSPEKATGSLLGLLLPLIMVLTLALGAFYPAVDLTAGEKERGTFESLLSTPTSKCEIVAGKFLAVFSLSMITGILNLGSMGATLLFLVRQMGDVSDLMGVTVHVPVKAFFMVMLVLIPLGFFISAVMMSVAVVARSFKEAQNYVTPFFLLILLPAFVAGMPGTELTFAGQFIPIYNVVLLFRELMVGRAGWEAVFAVFLSTAACAVLALQFAVWLFQREEVILSEERGIPLTWRRAEYRVRNTPTAAMAIAFFMLMLLGMFYIAAPVQQWRILPGLLITEWGLLFGSVVAFLWYFRISFKQTLSLRRPDWALLLAATLASIGAMLLLIQAESWRQRVLPMPKELAQELEKLFLGGDSPGYLLLLLFTIALTPAICEEVLFRGLILSGLRQRMPPIAAVIVVGLLFGLFHLSIYKLLPTAALGALLTYLTLRSRSIIPAVWTHFLNNGLAVLLATGWLPLSEADLRALDEQGFPRWVVIVAAACFVSGIVLTEWRARRPAQRPQGADRSD